MAQAALIAPLYWITEIRLFNLVFLASFALSASVCSARASTAPARRPPSSLQRTRSRRNRIASLPHIQVLSSAWMPFVLLGFRRYFVTGRKRDLVFAALAWVLQNLSCGYYLLFFAPVVAIYLVWEITTRGLWSNRRTISGIAVVGAAVGAATLPFLLPYLELRQLGFLPRSLGETRKYSADVYAYLTIDPNLRLWGSVMRAWPKAEGALFPGAVVVALALAGATAWRRVPAGEPTIASRLLTITALLVTVLTVGLLAGWSIRLPLVRITSLSRMLAVAGAAGVLIFTLSSRARVGLLAWSRSPAAVFSLLTLFAVIMSFGPQVRAMDRVVLDENLYALFYAYVPGYDGLRVPARFGMIVMLGLALLASLGLQRFSNRRPSLSVTPGSPGRWWPSAIFGALIALESFAAPIPVDGNATGYSRPGLAALPPLQLEPPPVYGFVATLPAGSVIVELPLGEPAFDVRYMYYSTRHWRRLVNGYSGGMPPAYEQLDVAMQDLFTRPERAWTLLADHRPGYAVVHDAYYASDLGGRVRQWLTANGATEIASFHTDHVFRLSE